MASLATTIARRRIYYPRPVAGLPDILMISIPRRFAGDGSALGRFLPIMIETIEEQAEMEAFINEDRQSVVVPNFLDDRFSTFTREHLTIAQYRPPRAAWPFVQLCQWPADFTMRTASRKRALARGAYTVELFRDRSALEEATRTLLTSLRGRHRFQVATIFPDWSVEPDSMPH